MIVDDSPIIVAWLRQMLAELEAIGKVLEAGSYKEALPLLHSSLPDIVLLDINLPEINGIELLRYIKSESPSAIVIMLTNQADEFYRIRCKKLGADYFLDKSSEFEQVPALVASLL